MSGPVPNRLHPQANQPPIPLPHTKPGSSGSYQLSDWLALALLVLLALGLRLLVWNWQTFYPLGGDEREYLQQALTLLQERRYTELRFMRPPIYTLLLASWVRLVGSEIQPLRLIQAIISAATIFPAYALVRHQFGQRSAIIAGILIALNYTLAATATELLTETVFLFGLSMVFWLLALTPTSPRPRLLAISSGLAIGLLSLVRSVALPLLPLSLLWLFLAMRPVRSPQPPAPAIPGNRAPAASHKPQTLLALLLAALLIIGPWTIRNYLAYGGLILIDTTGAENLWLDNDPLGREAVKQQLYALGEQRVLRQQLGSRNGMAAITSDPARFLTKAWGEAVKFFALQQFDDMRNRPVIWVPPLAVWLRLILGDGLWLLIVLAGVSGLWLAPRHPADMRWLMALWALYSLATAMLFHVELRYRLPLYPALLPYAAWLFAWMMHDPRGRPARHHPATLFAALATIAVILTLTLLHRPYLSESIMLVQKHWALTRAQQALDQHDYAAARTAATTALANDQRSVLARVLLARIALREHQVDQALHLLDEAEQILPDHPHPHLLRGLILRQQDQPEPAQTELGYETASLEDLQAVAWAMTSDISPAPVTLSLGGGLDLGFIRGFHHAEPGGGRWTTGQAQIRLAAPAHTTGLRLEVDGSRPPGTAPAMLTLLANGQALGSYTLRPGLQTMNVVLPQQIIGQPELIVTIDSPTFRPRNFDPASPDGRWLGVRVRAVTVEVRP